MRLVSLLVCSCAMLSGCAMSQSTVYPYGDGHYQVVTTARNEADASQGAVQKAQSICQERQKMLVVQNNETIYQGIDKNVHALLDVAHEASFSARGPMIPTGSSDTDYKTTMSFTCE